MKNRIHELVRSKIAEAYEYFIEDDKVKVSFCSKDRKIEKMLEDFTLEADFLDVYDELKKNNIVEFNGDYFIELHHFEKPIRSGWDDIDYIVDQEWQEVDQDEVYKIVLMLNK